MRDVTVYWPERAASSLYILTLHTDAAHEWVKSNVSDKGFQPDRDRLYVETLYLESLLQGMVDEGLEIGC